MEKRESRTRYTAEQKVEILREAEQPGVTVSEVCRRRGLAPSVLYRWRAVQVSPETKVAFRALARRENKSESALLKQLLGVMLRGVNGVEPVALERVDNANRQARLTIRLQAGDHLLLRERAASRTMPVTDRRRQAATAHCCELLVCCSSGVDEFVAEQRLS